MPAQRTKDDQPITVRPGDMLGKSDGSSDLMVHAMLFDEESDRFDVTNNTNLRIAHMGPPLGNATRTCDAVGGITLTDDQKLRIKEFTHLRVMIEDGICYRFSSVFQGWRVVKFSVSVSRQPLGIQRR